MKNIYRLKFDLKFVNNVEFNHVVYNGDSIKIFDWHDIDALYKRHCLESGVVTLCCDFKHSKEIRDSYDLLKDEYDSLDDFKKDCIKFQEEGRKKNEKEKQVRDAIEQKKFKDIISANSSFEKKWKFSTYAFWIATILNSGILIFNLFLICN